MNVICTNCKISKTRDQFYTRETGKCYSWCKSCNHDAVINRQRELKRLCVEFMGGKCEDCKGIFHPAVYDFHHLDPAQKDFSLSKRSTTKFNDLIMDELSKCVLLCSNCHRLRHTGY